MQPLRLAALGVALLLPGTDARAERGCDAPDVASADVARCDDARLALSQRRYQDAAALLEPLAAQQPQYYAAHLTLGLAYANVGEPDRSLLYLERAARLRQQQGIQDFEVYNALGWVHMSAADYQLAESSFLEGIAHEANNPLELNRKLYTNIGLLYYTLRRIDPARNYLRIAHEKYASETARRTLELVDKLEQTRWELIGQRIWLNEGGGRRENLTHWGKGEDHASMGIGHFIWYAKGRDGPFQETFPDLLAYLESKQVTLPAWLARERDCPWNTRDEFVQALESERMRGLRELLANTVAYQVEFLSARLSGALPKMISALPDDEARRVKAQYQRVATTDTGAASPAGIYALLDYVHFKGEGVDPRERYKGEGWGLLQVLQDMADDGDARVEFARAAERVLRRRIANAPRDESRWLEGWRNRLRTYTETHLNEMPG
jgi:Tfp pilus assembly protein PilF